jgi:hypothetical protein
MDQVKKRTLQQVLNQQKNIENYIQGKDVALSKLSEAERTNPLIYKGVTEMDPEITRKTQLNENNINRLNILADMDRSSASLEELQARAAAKAEAERYPELRKRLRHRVESFPAIVNDE